MMIGGCIKLSLVTSKHRWLYQDMSGYINVSVAISRYRWLHTVSMAISRYRWVYQGIGDYMWVSMVISRYRWLHQGIDGYIKVSMTISRYRWWYQGIDGGWLHQGIYGYINVLMVTSRPNRISQSPSRSLTYHPDTRHIPFEDNHERHEVEWTRKAELERLNLCQQAKHSKLYYDLLWAKQRKRLKHQHFQWRSVCFAQYRTHNKQSIPETPQY